MADMSWYVFTVRHHTAGPKASHRRLHMRRPKSLQWLHLGRSGMLDGTLRWCSICHWDSFKVIRWLCMWLERSFFDWNWQELKHVRQEELVVRHILWSWYIDTWHVRKGNERRTNECEPELPTMQDDKYRQPFSILMLENTASTLVRRRACAVHW
jgi:hypothetical protein